MKKTKYILLLKSWGDDWEDVFEGPLRSARLRQREDYPRTKTKILRETTETTTVRKGQKY